MEIVVKKYGGTSICAKGFNRIKSEIKAGEKTIIVLSAMKKTTNDLYNYVNTQNIDFLNNILTRHEKLCEELNINSNYINYLIELIKNNKNLSLEEKGMNFPSSINQKILIIFQLIVNFFVIKNLLIKNYQNLIYLLFKDLLHLH